MNKKDKEIIRNLAGRTAEIAALPIQEEKRSMWRKLNGLKPERPMVMIDQVCWNEMNVDDELTLLCEDSTLRQWEQTLRRQLYQWKRFPVDSVVEDFFRIPKAIGGHSMEHGPMDMGVNVEQHTLSTNETSSIVSHQYINQFEDIDDLKKIKMPVIWHDKAETNRLENLAGEVFDGLLKVRMDGWDPYISVWDVIATWMSVEDALYALIDQPEMMLALTRKMVSAYMTGLDQLEEQGLLCAPQSLIHCTGAWIDELPEYNESGQWATKQIWMFGLAQMLATVSPAMFDAYEIEINMPLFERFGLVYYGCCDPLDRKMDQVRRIPNLRKVSISPWASTILSAEAIGRDFVFSAKPNPTYLANFDEGAIRSEIKETIKVCEANHCPLELILKDISTVGNEPERLWRWAQIVMEMVQQ